MLCKSLFTQYLVHELIGQTEYCTYGDAYVSCFPVDKHFISCLICLMKSLKKRNINIFHFVMSFITFSFSSFQAKSVGGS